MASLKISLPHQLPPEEALKRIKNLLKESKERYSSQLDSIKEQWSGNTGKFSISAQGVTLTGTTTVHPTTIDISLEVPWPASMFKGKIESIIKTQAKKLLK